MIPILWYVAGAAIFVAVAYRNLRRLRTPAARGASLVRLLPWATFFFWPWRAADFAGLAIESAAVFAVSFATTWYARAVLRDADRIAAT